MTLPLSTMRAATSAAEPIQPPAALRSRSLRMRRSAARSCCLLVVRATVPQKRSTAPVTTPAAHSTRHSASVRSFRHERRAAPCCCCRGARRRARCCCAHRQGDIASCCCCCDCCCCAHRHCDVSRGARGAAEPDRAGVRVALAAGAVPAGRGDADAAAQWRPADGACHGHEERQACAAARQVELHHDGEAQRQSAATVSAALQGRRTCLLLLHHLRVLQRGQTRRQEGRKEGARGGEK